LGPGYFIVYARRTDRARSPRICLEIRSDICCDASNLQNRTDYVFTSDIVIELEALKSN